MTASIRAAALVGLISVYGVGCASTGATPRPFPMPERAPAAQPSNPAGGHVEPDASVAADASVPPHASVLPGTSAGIVEAALELRGTPYRNGGSDPSGFDCSGFTQFVFARFDLLLPREVHDQYQHGRAIARPDTRPGDLVFFSTVSRGASHVGIVIDGDRFVHAPSSTGVVRVESMDSRYWRERFVGIRRIWPE